MGGILAKKNCYTSIGGQAIIEGVMMRNDFYGENISRIGMAVRRPDGEIELEFTESPRTKKWYRTTPFVRGIFNFISMLQVGYKTLMRSADIAGFEEEEPTGFEKKLRDTLGDNFSAVFGAVALILGLILAVGLFTALPASLSFLFGSAISSPFMLTLLEGVMKIVIFVAYLALISKMKDIRRVFEYHGAEHKTIFCYEHGDELTVENVRKYTRFHPRCGTSFLLIVLVISIIVFSVVTWENLLMRIFLKILLLPLVIGVAYEIIKFAGRHDNILTRIISAPGLWLQRLTTREPDDSEIEIGIAAMKSVLPDNN